MQLEPMSFDLQFFSEGGGESADTGAFAGSAAENPQAEGMAAGGEGEQAAPAGDRPSFDELIKGEYKKEYGKKIQEAINQRFKNQQDLQSRIDAVDPIIMLMAERYDVRPDDDGNISLDELHRRIMDDNSMYEEEAFQRGMKVEDLKRLKQLEAQNAQLRRANEIRDREEESRREYDQLVVQGEELKALYPDFDLNEEMQNPAFGRLIAVNVPLQTAYEVVHKDDILRGGMQYAVQKTEQKIANSIRSGSRRPSENGTSSNASADPGRVDPRSFTRRDFQDFKRRAERGERITF